MRTAAALLALLLAACGPASAAGRDLNVVLVAVNSLRADRLAAYGYPEETAPNISRIAREGTVFENAFTTSHWTLPALASLLTSRYPLAHGVYERGQALPAGALTLAEALRAGGWRTAAFTGGLDMAGAYGLARGFDVYYDETGAAPMGSFAGLVPRALSWAAGAPGKFFLFIDAYDVHPPFDKPLPAGRRAACPAALLGRPLDYGNLRDLAGRASPADLACVRAAYDAGVAYADAQLGALFDGLQALGLSTGTAVVVLSEHGEELGERGTFDRYGRATLYDEVVRVPLIFRLPGRPGGARVRAAASLADVMPSILDLAGLPAPDAAQGRSLFRPGPEEEERCAFAEAGPGRYMLRTAGWKLVRDAAGYALFDLAADPGETRDVARALPDTAYALARRLARWRREAGRAAGPAPRVTLTPEMRRKLREAGYWQ